MTHVTKFNEENFFNGGGSPVRLFHNGFLHRQVCQSAHARATVSKQANSHHAKSHLWRFPSLSGQGFPCRGRRGSRCHYRSPRPDGIRTDRPVSPAGAPLHYVPSESSTGSGSCRTDQTCAEASAIQINFSATEAMIFSRVSAAPPPLIICMWPLISSAPST